MFHAGIPTEYDDFHSRTPNQPFARRIRHETGIKTGAVGMINDPAQARSIITGGDADLVLLARELLRDRLQSARKIVGLEYRGTQIVHGAPALGDRLVGAFECLFELFLCLSLRQQFVHYLQTQHQPLKTL